MLLVFAFTFVEGRLMVNPKTIDSVTAKAITKEKIEQAIVIDSESETSQSQRTVTQSISTSNISCRKRKKETVMEAIDCRVRIMKF